jgi:hypothetical protein
VRAIANVVCDAKRGHPDLRDSRADHSSGVRRARRVRLREDADLRPLARTGDVALLADDDVLVHALL